MQGQKDMIAVISQRENNKIKSEHLKLNHVKIKHI